MSIVASPRSTPPRLPPPGLDRGLVADSGRAQDQGRTYTITYGKTYGTVHDLAPKGLGRGKGQRRRPAVQRRDDPAQRRGAGGRLQFTFIVSQKKARLWTVRAGTISGVYKFADGSIFIEAEGTFADGDTDHGAIVGGTGAYANARGTVDSDKSHDVLHLLP